MSLVQTLFSGTYTSCGLDNSVYCTLHFSVAWTTSRSVCAVYYLLCAWCLNVPHTVNIGSSFTFLCSPQRLIFPCSRFPNFTTTPGSSPVHIQLPSHPYKLSLQFASLNWNVHRVCSLLSSANKAWCKAEVKLVLRHDMKLCKGDWIVTCRSAIADYQVTVVEQNRIWVRAIPGPMHLGLKTGPLCPVFCAKLKEPSFFNLLAPAFYI